MLPSNLKKATTVVYYGCLLLLGLGVYRYEATLSLFDRASNGGSLLAIWNGIAYYFRHADSWNVIFLILFVSICMLAFMIIFSLWGTFYQFMGTKYQRLQWLRSDWFRMTGHAGISIVTLFLVFVMACNGIMYGFGRLGALDVAQEGGRLPVLLLGTSKWLSSGNGENAYYRYRIDAVEKLFHQGIAEYVIISGDKTLGRQAGQDSLGYDETRDMREDLIEKGIPVSKIKLDTAGYRTLDSVLRLKKLFGLNEVVIVSQEFHIQRALFLSWFYGLTAYGYDAGGTATSQMMIRELFAKPKVILDLFFFNMQPRVLTAYGSAYAFRDQFKVQSDDEVLLLISLGLFALMAFVGVVKMV